MSGARGGRRAVPERAVPKRALAGPRPWSAGRWVVVAVVAFALAFALGAGLAALGTRGAAATPPVPTGGTYRNAQYHLSLTYPNGWQVTIAPQAAAASSLTVIITRSADQASGLAVASNLTIAAQPMSPAAAAATARALASDKAQRPLRLAGLPAYAGQPHSSQLPDSDATVTHQTYSLIHGGYLYQISTDAVSSDHAGPALASMLAGLRIQP